MRKFKIFNVIYLDPVVVSISSPPPPPPSPYKRLILTDTEALRYYTFKMKGLIFPFLFV